MKPEHTETETLARDALTIVREYLVSLRANRRKMTARDALALVELSAALTRGAKPPPDKSEPAKAGPPTLDELESMLANLEPKDPIHASP